ncbi:MAG: hypothetical protein JXN61_10050 [Sedimentisphaerales bacterium]|nr:hypothetical protein [Sedimentisphaerales bacterium]
MNLKQAQKVVSDYGGFMECALRPFHIIFMAYIPKSLLPYPLQYIEDAINIVGKYHHELGNTAKVNTLQECHAFLLGFEDDEKAILEAGTRFNEKKWRDLVAELIRGYRSNPNHQKYISGFFTDKPLMQVDFENPEYSAAYKIMTIYSTFLKYAHMGLSFIFCRKIPESFLPFPKQHLVNALDACSIGDDRNAEVYTSGKAILEEDYVDDEVAISEMIKNLSDKEIRASIISDIKKFQRESAYNMNERNQEPFS